MKDTTLRGGGTGRKFSKGKVIRGGQIIKANLWKKKSNKGGKEKSTQTMGSGGSSSLEAHHENFLQSFKIARGKERNSLTFRGSLRTVSEKIQGRLVLPGVYCAEQGRAAKVLGFYTSKRGPH